MLRSGLSRRILCTYRPSLPAIDVISTRSLNVDRELPPVGRGTPKRFVGTAWSGSGRNQQVTFSEARWLLL